MGFFRSSFLGSGSSPTSGGDGESLAMIALLKAKIDQLEDQVAHKDGVIVDLRRGLEGNLKCVSKFNLMSRRRSSVDTAALTACTASMRTLQTAAEEDTTSSLSGGSGEDDDDPYNNYSYREENVVVNRLTTQLEDKNGEIASLQLRVEEQTLRAHHLQEKLKAAEQAKQTLLENIKAQEKTIFDQTNQIECLQALNETNTTIVGEMDLNTSHNNNNQWKMYEKLQTLMDNNNRMAQQISTITQEKQDALQIVTSLHKEKLNLEDQMDSLRQEIQRKDEKLQQILMMEIAAGTTVTTTEMSTEEEQDSEEEALATSSSSPAADQDPEEQFEELLEHQRRRSSVQTDQIQQVLQCLSMSASCDDHATDTNTTTTTTSNKFNDQSHDPTATTDSTTSSSNSTDPKLLQLSLQVCQSQLKQIQKEHEMQIQKTVQQSMQLAESRAQVDTLTGKVYHYEKLMDTYIKNSAMIQQQQQQQKGSTTPTAAATVTPTASSSSTTSKAAREFMSEEMVVAEEPPRTTTPTSSSATKSPSGYASHTRNALKRLSLPKFMNLRSSSGSSWGVVAGGGVGKSPTTPTTTTATIPLSPRVAAGLEITSMETTTTTTATTANNFLQPEQQLQYPIITPSPRTTGSATTNFGDDDDDDNSVDVDVDVDDDDLLGITTTSSC